MDILMQIIQKLWQIFMSVSIPVSYQGTTYNITLYALLIFTSVVSIVITLIAKALD